ncbi:MAG: TonB-dependent receptor plug domain-containing protein [Sphingobium phenoxybenzoativorans]
MTYYSKNFLSLATSLAAIGIALTAQSALAADAGEASAQTETSADQSSAPAANTSAEEYGDMVIVTGSRTAGRTVYTSESPIDSFSAEDITRTTKTDLLESLAVLVPSLDLPRTPGSSARIVRGPYLRGLSPGHTLVLVNGKRRHATSTLGVGGTSAAQSVDIAMIPSAAIERMEVLRDGASAIYGSDAIAGVINFITKKDDTGLTAFGRFGTFGDGEGKTYSAYIGKGFQLGEQGHLYVTAQYEKRGRTFRGSPVPSDILYYFPLNASGNPILPRGALTQPTLPAGATPDPREATRDSNASQIQGESPYTTKSLSADLGFELSDSVRFYSFGTYAERDADLFNAFRLPLRNENVRAIFPDGFSPIRDQKEKDFEVMVGLEGDIGSWNWDISTTYGGNKARIGAHDTVNPSYGLDSKTKFYIGTTDYTAWTTNIGVKRAFDLPISAKPVEFAAGAEYRKEKFLVHAGEPQSYSCGGASVLDGPNAGMPLTSYSYCGSQAVFGYTPDNEVNATRNNKSAYAELSFYPLENWSISAAGRIEDYSDFGTAKIGRLSTRFEIIPALALRATIGNAFQAPTLATISYRAQVNWGTYIAFSFPVTSPEALALGSQPLEPERSNNLSAGFVATLSDRIHLSVDAYQIKVKDRVSLSTTIRDAIYPGSGALLVSVGLEPDAAINYFINAANTRTRGVEAVLDGLVDMNDLGRLRWSLSANYNRTKVTGLAETSPVLAAFNVPVFSLADTRNLENRSPRSKVVADFVWSIGKFDLNLRETYFGKTIRYGTPTTIPTSGPYAGMREIGYNIGNLFTTDANINYNINDQFTLSLSANNLFAKKPALMPVPLLQPIQSYAYDESGPVSSDGAFFAVGLRAKW